MIKSMTGYGRGSNEYFVVEIQAVNHKYCEIKFSTPYFMTSLENKIAEYVKEKIIRGRLYIPINFKNTELPKFQIDTELAKTYLNSWRELGKTLQLKNDIKLSHIIGITGIVSKNFAVESKNKLWEWIKEPLDDALEELIAARISEGRKIEAEFKTRLDTIEGLVTEIEKRVPVVIAEYKEKLQKRLETLQINKEFFDETRLYQEIALFTDKSDITEELLRLRSHLQQFEEILTLEKSIGRQLDFLGQELHREINTVGSKTGDIKIIQLVLQTKNELEKIREQIQNVE